MSYRVFSPLVRLLGIVAAGILSISTAGAVEVERFPDSSRLVAIGGSLLEIVYALGEEERLAARDSTGVYPPEAMSLPDVGYMRALSPEGVISVNPTAILMLEGSGPPEAVEVIRKASIPVVVVPDRFDLEGILTKIRVVGRALGVEEKASALASHVESDIKAAEATLGKVGNRKRVLFILSLQGGRLLASGTNTAADGIIRMAGGINAIEGFEGYKQLSDEAVFEAQPEVVLMMDREGDHGPEEAELFSHPAMAGTPAAQNRAFVRMDGAWLLGFGPRTASAVRELSARIYGEAAGN